MKTLVLVRHGESVYNRANIFTGWTDVPLTPEGEQEAIEAGKILKEKGFDFDLTYTSVLQRAIKTLWLILEQMDRMWLPEIKTWRLNEKHYGKLQGLNKSEMAAQYGEEQVLLWRRAYDVRPPLLSEDEIADMRKESRYADVDNIQYMLGESLKDTVERVIPLWENQIKYDLLDNKRVLISAHGNSLRGVVKYLDQMSEDEILHFNIPTGIPLVYQLDDNLKPINRYFLADEEKLKAAIDKVANQGKAK
ncbi:MAG TPA: 2,3-diphosphoglycerate-dependent phosphoglycerate mutase [Bacteroidales bacterium]|jgi:2,3-bisphosphoglycerate-dependent phosphoglycerate mutase|nr:2,3-diphosphoglycerate-dependent phosphoglycerate mutase [Bacteroidales bacterium]OQC46309.1 MAG: 2,3-bisphosphoglycerate-dependent phosphoglycerate mutase [Bacteroidetes bacterium ADurb.Bin035]HCM29713.1 2,3-diphosphoglycerate-dependent phosphoglycerate mutase [Bacteroidales bacterium]HNQ19716.1 2,3-diphosphoglycerate-dependent phosphoglycerate mutase [Bacteroidales bacterium]HNY76076.1 2,3-diphosphoglycerate-dependent phosphoglycerate mutase [Bacteroidales bacterium]